MQKFDLGQKLLTILVFCLFERNCRLLLDLTGDSESHSKIGKISENFPRNFFEKYCTRKFGIVDNGLDCDPEGRGLDSSQRKYFKVTRKNK